MFFIKKETVSSYLRKDLDNGIKSGIKEGIIDLNNPLAGMFIRSFIGEARKAFKQNARLIADRYSVTVEEVHKQIDIKIKAFTNKWIE